MATLQSFRCKNCGFDVFTVPLGHYALMSGEYYNFHCHKCHDIVNISAADLAEAGYPPTCPDCGSEEIECWSPNGQCPSCGAHGTITLDPDAPMLMAD